MEIEGRVAIVTGAAAGIGRATAVRLAQLGAKGVVLADVDEAGARTTADLIDGAGSPGRSLVVPTDVTRLASLEALYAASVERFGGVDIVFNNAGIVSGPPPFPDTDPARVKLLIDIDLTSVVVSTQIAVRHMRERGGVIVNTASTGGLNPYLADAPYAAAKAGVIMFSRSCKDLHRMHGIRVNAVCPGVTETPILEKLGGGERPDWLAPILKNIEMLSPAEIAEAVVGIIRDDAMAGDYVVVGNRTTSA
jgi:NAD(P)-dependent dehydrogenase (short-subunit alcohol dehydrogenase family)